MSIDYESLKDKAVVAAQTGVTKVKEITEIGKLKMNNSAEQESIRKAYSELGKLYYAERGSAPEAPYAEACQRITDALARISYNNERIADIKAAGQITDEEVEAEMEEFTEEDPVEEAAVDEVPVEDEDKTE